jgi:NAD+ kinase
VSAFAFVRHPDRSVDLARSTADWLLERGHEVRMTVEDAAALGRPDLGVPVDELAVGVDLVVSLGGDGTMLRAVDRAVREDVPVLGVNLGQLGYLTAVEPSGVTVALKRFLAGSHGVEERMRLDVAIERAGAEPETLGALNEAVVEKSEPGHTVRLEVQLDGRPFTSYVADGLVLATPTGSTAYAFSVRGPILDPELRTVLLVPVAAHMLFDRALVLRPDCEVTVTVAGDRTAGLSVDGRPGGRLEPGDVVRCRGAEVPARLVTFGEHDFHAVLRTKFSLSDR